MSEVKRLCDRVAIMNRGVILAEGTPAHLAEKHQENDMEELFYQLISRSEAQLQAEKSAAVVTHNFTLPLAN
jgi:sodium transport system ATP-binding protein